MASRYVMYSGHYLRNILSVVVWVSPCVTPESCSSLAVDQNSVYSMFSHLWYKSPYRLRKFTLTFTYANG